MFEEKVPAHIAIEEVNSWLDAKRINPRKRETLLDAIENIVDGVRFGYLSIDAQTKEITHNLLFPINDDAGNEVLGKLVYKGRINSFMLEPHTKNLKPGDGGGRLNAYVTALTGVSSTMLGKLDTEDRSTSHSIAVFFA